MNYFTKKVVCLMAILAMTVAVAGCDSLTGTKPVPQKACPEAKDCPEQVTSVPVITTTVVPPLLDCEQAKGELETKRTAFLALRNDFFAAKTKFDQAKRAFKLDTAKYNGSLAFKAKLCKERVVRRTPRTKYTKRLIDSKPAPTAPATKPAKKLAVVKPSKGKANVWSYSDAEKGVVRAGSGASMAW